MQYRRLGASGLQVSVLALGAATFGDGEQFRDWGVTADAAKVRRIVDAAIEAGVNLFDTSDAYSAGASEAALGKAIGERRSQVLIATKACYRTEPGPNGIGASRHHLIRACEASLRRLGTDHIDLYQMHAFDAMTPVEETLAALDSLVRAGKVRYIGASNYSGWHLMKSLAASERLGLARFVAHQAYYALAGRDYEWELMPLALDQNVATLAWSPLAGAKLTGKIRRGSPAPAETRAAANVWASPPIEDEYLYRIVDALDAVAGETGKSVPQIALNWLLQRPTVASVIVGARNLDQFRDNLGAADWNLSPEQAARLDAASAVEPPYPYWHQRITFGERNPPAAG
jgi:aryl-alcohol dehydrogenase-like predicted oxidoreductase